MRTFLFCFLIFSPFAFMVLVNEASDQPISEYRKNQCTRYCHSIGCLHVVEKYKNSSSTFIKESQKMYRATIAWLGNSGTGLNYRETNLAVFMGVTPFLMVILLWGALRKK